VPHTILVGVKRREMSDAKLNLSHLQSATSLLPMSYALIFSLPWLLFPPPLLSLLTERSRDVRSGVCEPHDQLDQSLVCECRITSLCSSIPDGVGLQNLDNFHFKECA